MVSITGLTWASCILFRDGPGSPYDFLLRIIQHSDAHWPPGNIPIPTLMSENEQLWVSWAKSWFHRENDILGGEKKQMYKGLEAWGSFVYWRCVNGFNIIEQKMSVGQEAKELDMGWRWNVSLQRPVNEAGDLILILKLTGNPWWCFSNGRGCSNHSQCGKFIMSSYGVRGGRLEGWVRMLGEPIWISNLEQKQIGWRGWEQRDAQGGLLYGTLL